MTRLDLANEYVELFMEYLERVRIDGGHERREPPANDALAAMPMDMLLTRMLDIELQLNAMNEEKAR